jgi:predicted Zn-dependent peptidase
MASLRNEVSIPARRLRSLLLSVVLIAGIGVSGTALTPNGPHPDQPPQREILLNGLRVVAVNRPGDRVAVVCVVRAGAMFDPAGKSGLANLTAGLLLAGAGSYTGDRIRGELEDANATLEIRTDWDATWIEAEAPAAQLTTLLDVMSLMVSSPKFAPEDVERLKRAALDRVRAEEADASAAADRAFAQALYGKHTYGRSIWGDRASLESIKAGDVKVFFEKFYASNTGVVVVAGPVEGDAVMNLARARFGRWSKKKVVPATFLPPAQSSETRVVVVNNRTAGRAVVRAGFFSVGRDSGDAAIVKVLAERLGADLAHRIGESDVAATFELRTLQSPFVVSYAVPVSELGASIDAISAAMQAMQQGGPDGASKVYFPKAAASAREFAHALAAADYFGGQKLQPDPVDVSVDAARLAPAARASLKPGALVVVVVGDASEIAAALKDRFKIEVAPST